MSNFVRIAYFLEAALRRLHNSKESLRWYQERRLRALVHYAYDFVPYYHGKFRESGILPEDIRSLNDLAKLPGIGKNELRKVDLGGIVSAEFNLERLKPRRTVVRPEKPSSFTLLPLKMIGIEQ